MERLDDLMGELRSRVRSLKIQATKAEKYVTAKAEWSEGRTRLLSHRLLSAEGTAHARSVLRVASESEAPSRALRCNSLGSALWQRAGHSLRYRWATSP